MSDEPMSMKELGDWVDEQGGVGAVTLGELRDAVESEKLGKLVMQRITQELAAHGLGYFPRGLLDANPTPRQHQQVRLYRKGSNAAARAIEAVLDPSEVGDAFLSELGNNNAQDLLARVRELLSTGD
jgi:hypothetical protein